MSEKILRQTDDLLLAGVLWDQADTRIFPALLSGLACSTLKVAAFFAPPGPNPDEAFCAKWPNGFAVSFLPPAPSTDGRSHTG